MKRARLGIAFAFVFLALPVAANAPIAPPSERQYEDFDQTTVRITDRFTKLVWERAVSGPIDYAAAQAYCNRGTTPPTRIPTLKELLTLVDEEPNRMYDEAAGTEIVKHIDLNAFRETPVNEEYWTSSLNRDDGKLFTVSFKTGQSATAAPNDARRVRCVQALP